MVTTKTMTPKKTKQQKVIALRAKYPDMANKDIATKVGCNATYVSQVLRGGTTACATPATVTTTTVAKRRTGIVEPTATQTLLTAYHDMQCIVKRVGTCYA